MRALLLSVAGLIALADCLSCSDSLAVPPVSSSPPLHLYMSARGDDRNPGSSKEPVLSLARVHEILMQQRPDADVVVKIRSDEGIYWNQSVLWCYYNKGHSIVMESDPPETNACFLADDSPPHEPFFTLSAANGEATNLILRGLTVSNYVTRAILFAGNGEVRSKWNGFNAIENCIFQDIGNARMPERPVAYSAIGLVNSRNNRIVNCSFINIMDHTVAGYPQRDQRPDNPILGIGDDYKNARAQRGGNPNLPIIGIYVAHHSDSNRVISCRFRRMKGDAIRIRDDSNGNLVSRNVFELTGWHAVISTWYCRTSMEGCSERLETEAASWGNVFTDNKVNGNWKGGKPTVFLDLTPADGLSESDGRPGVILRNNTARPYVRRLVQVEKRGLECRAGSP
jgi:hypothetical protein